MATYLAFAPTLEAKDSTKVEMVKRHDSKWLKIKPSKKKFAEPKDSLWDRITDSVSSFMQDLTKRQNKKSGLYKMATASQPLTQEEWLMRTDSLYTTDVDRAPNMQKIADYLREESKQVVISRTKNLISLFNKVEKGLNYELSLRPTASSMKKVKGVRYGLRLKSIKSPNAPMNQAAIGPIDINSYNNASKAELEWTIAPVVEQEKKLFSYKNIQKKEATLWGLTSIPDPSFRFNIKPTAGAIQDIQKFGKPSFIFSMTQVEGLYRLVYVNERAGEKTSTSHEFNLPVYGTLKLSRLYNEHFEAEQTAIRGILLSKSLPVFNMYFKRQYRVDGVMRDYQYIGELGYGFNGHKVGFSILGSYIDEANYRPNKYLTSYSVKF